ncbi:HAD-IA family hydrolase [Bradyrhizobium sp. OK095]|jgi:putative hydrolase of the HAD superfamily|uniref:HAD family hydrolase n=1 Tax=Bradyrhizobium sp. OK095 TaxID=1882760 RepID=UPI0008CBA07B|nr:HAD-IA family hydrolase [Bradyrhizobium sp. OK095]SEM74979.1 putative hydrolase of the HAD superfamily [Bradyrhizobium sp. OK095]
MRAIETILFDADGVLQRPQTRWRLAFAALPTLVEDGLLDQFTRDILVVEAAFLECEDDFAAAVYELVSRVGHGLDTAAILAILNAIEVDAAIMNVVQSIRSLGTKCYLTTNQQVHRARHMSEALNYAGLFDGEFYSCRMGVAKPKPGYFEHVLAALKQPAESILFLDDRSENVAAAIQVGMRAEVFDGVAGASALLDLLAKHGVRPVSPPTSEWVRS